MSHAKTPVFTPLLLQLGTLLLAIALTDGARGQCDPPCPSGCPAICDVTTEAEFQAALNCYESSGHSSCSHIRIPLGVTLEVDSTFFLDNDHGGLHIEIIGTIEYTESDPDALLLDVNGTDDLTIDGGRNDYRH